MVKKVNQDVSLKWSANMFSSKGLKRRLASLVSVMSSIAMSVPALAGVVPILQWVAAALGGVGVTHAVTEGTVGQAKAASWASIFAVLLALTTQVPAFAPFAPLIQVLATIFGTAGVVSSKNT